MTCCFHCCHLYETQTLNIPFKYDHVHNKFHVKNIPFCSWECMRAYNKYNECSSKGSIFSLITQMQRLSSNCQKYLTAPPREALKIFGGSLSIDEFRKDNESDYSIINIPMIKCDTVLQKQSNFSWVDSNEANTNFTKFDDSVKNEPIKLSRQKTSQNQSTLEFTMGLKKQTS